jgi:hypothetical protein
VDEQIEVRRAAAPLLLTQRDKGRVRSKISSTTFDNSSDADALALIPLILWFDDSAEALVNPLTVVMLSS